MISGNGLPGFAGLLSETGTAGNLLSATLTDFCMHPPKRFSADVGQRHHPHYAVAAFHTLYCDSAGMSFPDRVSAVVLADEVRHVRNQIL
jgi:hypothetical protein